MKFKEIIGKAFRPVGAAAPKNIVRNLDEDGEVEILLYDQIGYWGITAEELVSDIKGIDAKVIHVRIDCPGGDVFMARSIKTALEQHPAKIIVHIDGLAASAASYIMLAGDEIIIAQGAFIMIHNAWTITVGDTNEHDDTAKFLDKIDGSIRHDYAAKTGKDAEEFRQLMNDETWLDADEALELGLVDKIYEKDGGTENRFDLSIYDNAPSALVVDEDKADRALLARQERRLELIERVAP